MKSPTVMKKFHGWLTVVWAVMMPVALWSGWVKSVIFISVLSIYALFIGHFSSWQATRVEVRQEEILEKKDEHFEKRVESKIDKIVE